MSDSLHIEIPGEDKQKSETKFQSSNIGRWASQQENPFAEQNRKILAKRQKSDEKRKKAAPYIIIATSVGAVALGVLGLVFLVMGLRGSLPDDVTLGSEGATEIQDQAQAVYDRYLNSDGEMTPEQAEEAIQAAMDFFNNKSDLTSDEETKAQLALLSLAFYGSNAQMQTVVDMADSVNVELLSREEQAEYYGILMNAAFSIENYELGEYYSEMLSQFIPQDEGGEG